MAYSMIVAGFLPVYRRALIFGFSSHAPCRLAHEGVLAGQTTPTFSCDAARVYRLQHYSGVVIASRDVSQIMASSAELKHISAVGFRLMQTLGRSGIPKIKQLLSSLSCTHRTPAGLPFGIPGIADEMEGAIQQAPQLGRQSIELLFWL